MLWIRMAFRMLFRNKGFALFFIFNLAMGLAGFIAVLSFSRSLERHMEDNLREILTADIEISSNTPLTMEEISLADEVLGKDTKKARLIRFYTMAGITGSDARLTEVMAIDEHYPLYGRFKLLNHTPVKTLEDVPAVFMTRDMADIPGFNDGPDMRPLLQLGGKSFEIKDYFIEDPGTSPASFELAPKIYMGIQQLEGTGLIKFGSRIRYSHFFKLRKEADNPLLTKELRDRFSEKFPGPPRLRINDTQDVNRRLSRVIGYFTRFMGLISIMGLFLSGIASAYLFRGYLNSRKKDMAVLLSMGSAKIRIFQTISTELMVMGSIASFFAVIISQALLPAFPVIFKGLLPDNIRLFTDTFTLVSSLFMGMAGGLIFCLPLFIRIFRIRPLMLLRDIREDTGFAINRLPGLLIGFLPLASFFFWISCHVAGSVRDGSTFAAGFALALAILSCMGWLIFSGCRILSHTRSMIGKIAFRNLFRNKWSSLSCFVSIAMGAFLMSIIPQIQKGLQNEISRPDGLKIPAFFLVDIQDEQKEPFVDLIKKEKADLSNLSPMVRGRIMTVNRQPFHDQNTPAKGGSGRGHRIEFNFSHRETLDVSETLVKGKPLTRTPWSFESGTPFDISVEGSFAEQYGINLGDIMGFEVQGIPLEGRVVNFRKVRWNSFQPNFYLLFQDGVLDEAPKTYLASVSHDSNEKRKDLKQKISKQFPNISIIDVTQLAGKILAITDRLSVSLKFMAWFSIAAGLVLIFSIARHEALKNQNQINLLKVLGADNTTVRAVTLLEFGFTGFVASLSGIGLGFGFSFTGAWYFFDSLWQFNPKASLIILVLTTLISMGTAFAASRKILNSKPARLLSGTA
ncbi:MAG: FtsX-like permease family protein [Desulfobacula sp.]